MDSTDALRRARTRSLAASAGVGVTLLALAASAWFGLSSSTRGDGAAGEADRASSSADQRGEAQAAATSDAARDGLAADDEANPAFDSPEGRAALAAHAERQRFEKALRDFLARSAALDAAERARIATELDAQVEAEELAGRMSADEARMLRLALIERSSDDATERLRRAEALADAYRRDAERRHREFERQQASDPRFRDYKTREAQVVAEVMALREIPGGISRDQYLRQRLQAERERAWSAPGG